jgi:thiol-disulfide isomerase/thioredoxin
MLCKWVQQLRALTFTGNKVHNARAVLIADQEDETEEANRLVKEEEIAIRQHQASMKSIRVDANFDRTKIPAIENDTVKAKTSSKTVKKEDVIFYADASTLESVILDSPISVLLDVYADWCELCKTLTPILEDIAMKAGGLFRLVKLNTDQERTISQALEVTALPTLSSIRYGHIQT